MKIQRLVSFFI